MDLDELQEEVFVDFPPGWGMRDANDQAFTAARASREVAYEINDATTVFDSARHGLAAGMITASIPDGSPGIVLVPVIRRYAPHFETAVVAPAGRRLGSATATLLATIRRTVGAGEPAESVRR